MPFVNKFTQEIKCVIIRNPINLFHNAVFVFYAERSSNKQKHLEDNNKQKTGKRAL